jgi:hypothetical protein
VNDEAGEWRDRLPTDIPSVAGADEPDESRIGLTPIAVKYGGASAPPCSIPARFLLRRPGAAPPARLTLRAIATVFRGAPMHAHSQFPADDEQPAGGDMDNGRLILARARLSTPSTPAARRA